VRYSIHGGSSEPFNSPSPTTTTPRLPPATGHLVCVLVFLCKIAIYIYIYLLCAPCRCVLERERWDAHAHAQDAAASSRAPSLEADSPAPGGGGEWWRRPLRRAQLATTPVRLPLFLVLPRQGGQRRRGRRSSNGCKTPRLLCLRLPVAPAHPLSPQHTAACHGTFHLQR
jgi:hypothetical protein